MGWIAGLVFLVFAATEVHLADRPWRILVWALFAGLLLGMGAARAVYRNWGEL